VRPRIVVFVALAILLAALFVRLGVWQLDRLAERRARNATLAARLAEPPVEFAALRDTSGYHRALLSGSPDYENEIVHTGRSRNGSPGVYLVTPVRRVDNDTAVAVVRGWIYAPDAATIDASKSREPRSSFRGYVLSLPAGAPATGTPTGRKVRTLTHAGLQQLLPYPVATVYLVAQDSVTETTAPARLAAPTLDNGPHLSYAIQWFCFAAIAVIGAAIVAVRARVSS
jgi:surfeit locus 1 family protein